MKNKFFKATYPDYFYIIIAENEEDAKSFLREELKINFLDENELENELSLYEFEEISNVDKGIIFSYDYEDFYWKD